MAEVQSDVSNRDLDGECASSSCPERRQLAKSPMDEKHQEGQVGENLLEDVSNPENVGSSIIGDDRVYPREFNVSLDESEVSVSPDMLLLVVPILSGILPSLFVIIALALDLPQLFQACDEMKKFVSLTADEQSQSVLYKFGHSLACPFLLLTILIRYEQGVLQFDQKHATINNASLASGWLVVVFQFLVSLPSILTSDWINAPSTLIHVICIIVYCSLQACISSNNERYHSKGMIYCRYFLVIGMSTGAFIYFTFTFLPRCVFNGNSQSIRETGKWLYCILKSVYLVSFNADFRHLRLSLLPKTEPEKEKGEKDKGTPKTGVPKSSSEVDSRKKIQ